MDHTASRSHRRPDGSASRLETSSTFPSSSAPADADQCMLMHAPDKLRSRRTGIHPRRGRRHRLAPTRWMNYTRVSFTIPHAGCGCNCFGSYGSSECLSCALPNGQLVWPDRRSPQRTPWRPAPRSRAGIRPSWRALQLPADLILGPYPQPSAAQAPLGASLWSSLAPVMVALLGSGDRQVTSAAGGCGGSARHGAVEERSGNSPAG
jgi:hypothetical protein